MGDIVTYNNVRLNFMLMERWLSWSKAPDSKSGERVTVPWVRIPLSPPIDKSQVFQGS